MPRLTMLVLRFLRMLTLFLPRARRAVPLPGWGGLTYTLDLRRLRVLPPLAGADGDDDDAGDDDADDADDDADADADDQDDDSDDADDDQDDDEVKEDELPENVKAILRKERKARRDAEREARRLKRERGEKPKPKPKPKKDDDDADDEPRRDVGAEKLRSANLLLALQEKGYNGARAKAVARLLDDVEFDANDEPVSLDDALADAEETYGTEMVAVKNDEAPKPKPRRPKTGGRDRGDDTPPNLTTAEVKAAEQAGKTPKEWAELKGVSNLQEWEALQARRREAANK